MAFIHSVNPSNETSQTPSARLRRKGKIALQDDEFMATAIGDLEWLKQALKKKSPYQLDYDKNVSL